MQAFGQRLNYLYIETESPPEPVTLTVGCMPVLFVPTKEPPEITYPNAAHYANPRVQDPCIEIRWPLLSNPRKHQKIAILTALGEIVNMKAINFLPSFTVVELQHDDQRIYEKNSLPGVVAGRTTLYHHSQTSFYDSMRDLKRERRLDPLRYLSAETGSLPQDTTNYLREPSAILTPGVRVSCGRGAPDTQSGDASFATSAGVRLRNTRSGLEAITLANHGFLFSDELFHPNEEDGIKTGDVFTRRPELDIALAKLTPSEADKFSNRVYFQEEVPLRLVDSEEIVQGAWAEVDGMSTGLVSLLSEGTADYKPERPAGHPEISFSELKIDTISRMFGATNNRMVAGMCGAPIVGCETGDVQGFFHLGNGCHARCATLDDLIAEGWALV